MKEIKDGNQDYQPLQLKKKQNQHWVINYRTEL